MSKQHQKSEDQNREELQAVKYPSRDWNPGPYKLQPVNLPLSYHPVPRHLCNKGFRVSTWYEKKSPPRENFGSLRHAAACFKTPMCSSKKQVLRHAAAALAWPPQSATEQHRNNIK